MDKRPRPLPQHTPWPQQGPDTFARLLQMAYSVGPCAREWNDFDTMGGKAMVTSVMQERLEKVYSAINRTVPPSALAPLECVISVAIKDVAEIG